MKYREQELTPHQLDRLRSLIPLDLLLKLFQKDTFIAGGAVVYVLVNDLTSDKVGDVDLFMNYQSDESLLKECASLIDDYFEKDQVYIRQKSTLKIYSTSNSALTKCPIQLIRSPGDLYNVIDSFDFDYVCCAITYKDGKFISICTSYAVEAHKTRTIKCILDYRYNPLRLRGRLNKASHKGFDMPKRYRQLNDLDIRFYTPPHKSYKT